MLSSTALYERMARERRLLHSRWDEYDTRHCVFQAKHLRPEELEEGYWRAYDEFYQWGSILRGAWAKPGTRVSQPSSTAWSSNTLKRTPSV